MAGPFDIARARRQAPMRGSKEAPAGEDRRPGKDRMTWSESLKEWLLHELERSYAASGLGLAGGRWLVSS